MKMIDKYGALDWGFEFGVGQIRSVLRPKTSVSYSVAVFLLSFSASCSTTS